jgi:hypothetical protein
VPHLTASLCGEKERGVFMAKKKFTVGGQLTDEFKVFNPFIKFGGKWLKEYGFNVGDKLELIQGKNMLIFIKVPNDT